MRGDLLGGNVAKVESLATRLNRLRNFVRLGRAQNELHMRRRFFHGLEQRVERGRREHVHFVDDVNAIFAARGRQSSTGDQVACVVDATIRCTVNFNDIEILATQNRITDGLGFNERGITVERTRVNPRHRSLAHAACATEEIRMGGASVFDRVLQRARNRFLANDLAEVARAIAPCENGVGLGRVGRGRARACFRGCRSQRHRGR